MSADRNDEDNSSASTAGMDVVVAAAPAAAAADNENVVQEPMEQLRQATNLLHVSTGTSLTAAKVEDMDAHSGKSTSTTAGGAITNQLQFSAVGGRSGKSISSTTLDQGTICTYSVPSKWSGEISTLSQEPFKSTSEQGRESFCSTTITLLLQAQQKQLSDTTMQDVQALQRELSDTTMQEAQAALQRELSDTTIHDDVDDNSNRDMTNTLMKQSPQPPQKAKMQKQSGSINFGRMHQQELKSRGRTACCASAERATAISNNNNGDIPTPFAPTSGSGITQQNSPNMNSSLPHGQPAPNDVVCELPNATHRGTEQFRKEVHIRHVDYIKGNDARKNELVNELMAFVHKQKGMFLKENSKGWVEVNDEEQKKMIRQSLQEPTSLDVISGRGNAIDQHNQFFRDQVNKRCVEYDQGNRKRKTDIVNELKTWVWKGGGLFLKENSTDWVEMDESTMNDKIRQRLRDCYNLTHNDLDDDTDMPTTVTAPTGKDVIAGRGTNKHNNSFLNEVRNRYIMYDNGNRDEKTRIVNELILLVRNQGGRFLKKGSKGWVNMNEKDVNEKIRQSLRDCKDKKSNSNDNGNVRTAMLQPTEHDVSNLEAGEAANARSESFLEKCQRRSFEYFQGDGKAQLTLEEEWICVRTQGVNFFKKDSRGVDLKLMTQM